MRSRRTNQKGFTLIELLIVIAIIGILAAVLIPNLLGARKRAYDTAAQSCAKSIQTAEAVYQIDNQEWFGGTVTLDGSGDLKDLNSACNSGHIAAPTITSSTDGYSFTIADDRGATTYTVTNSSLTGAPN